MIPGNTAALLAVVGTDTGVGKTVVGTGLIHCLKQEGLRVAAFKPVETGLEDGHLAGDRADWERLAEASGQDPHTCLGQSYALPAAPLAAARQVGEAVPTERLTADLQVLRKDRDWVLVEGAGGLCVPFDEDRLWANVLQLWRPVCLVVGRLGLGTLNHTLLTLTELKRRGIPVLGVVLNTLGPPGPESSQTPDLIDKFGGFPVFDVIPHGCISPSEVAQRLRNSGVVERLISRCRND